MRSLVFVMVVSTGLGLAQNSQAPRTEAAKPGGAQPPAHTASLRRLESVTWNPQTAELSWVLSSWDPNAGTEQTPSKESYTIRVDAALMKFNGEGRHFDPEEARQVGVLLDLISTYAVESTVWWDRGPDAKPDGNVIPAPDSDSQVKGNDGKDKDKDSKDKDKAKPAPKAAPVLLHGPVAAKSVPEAAAPAAGSH